MATATLLAPAVGATAVRPLHRFSVAEYHRMIRTGILTEDHRVELLEGVIVDKMPHNPPHDGTITRIQRRLAQQISEDWLIRVRCAITLRDSEPEPDLALVKGPEEVYFARHPGPRDILLLIEVADTTLEGDRQVKGRMYARARIPVYWIINLNDRRVEVYTAPKGGKSPAYRRRIDYASDAKLSLAIEGEELGQVRVSDLLPSRA
ncbi:MAG: Uma2 family endonuclease [Gemmataceae bacterium]